MQAVRLDVGEDGRWLLVLASLGVVELTWWTLCWLAGIAPAPFLGTYLVLAVGGLVAALALRMAFSPGAERPTWTALVLGTLLTAIAASLFLPLKYAIPAQVPFWLDGPLAAAERMVLGVDAWIVADRLLGWALVPVDRIYGLWLPVQTVALFSVMLMTPSAAKTRALIGYTLAWFLLGVVAATAFASAGPIFYDRLLGGTDFAPLAERLRTGGAAMALRESDSMWASFASARPGFVAGISALPSLHVAISMWMWLAARTLAPRMAPLALAYAIFIAAASVQLGWHYIADGLAAVIGMAAVWWLAGQVESRL
jgi:hypothetical protein